MRGGLQNGGGFALINKIAQLQQEIREMEISSKIPEHEWDGTKIRFQNADGTFGDYVDLRGTGGTDGKDGKDGKDGTNGNNGTNADPAQMNSLLTEYQTACGLMSNLTLIVNNLNTSVHQVQTQQQNYATLQQNFNNLQTLVNTLAAQKVSFGAAPVSLNLLAVNAVKDVEISFVSNLPSANYTWKHIVCNVSGIALTSLIITEKTKEIGKITLTIKNTGISVLTGSFTILLLAQGTPS